MAKTVYIVSAVRTPIGKFGGMLADFTHPDLGTIAVRAALERAFGLPLPQERTPGEFAHAPVTGAGREIPRDADGVPRNDKQNSGVAWHVDEVIFGNARPAGVGPNPARQVAWRSGLGDDVPAFTVNMACASGLRAVVLGWQEILTGGAEIIVAGGAESMSRVPYLVEGRWGFKLGNQPLIDAMYRDGFVCPISKLIMGETAEILAEQYKISRDEQDAFALESHRRAGRAAAECHFKAEMVPIEVKDKKGQHHAARQRRARTRGRDARGAGEAAAGVQQDRQRERGEFERHHGRRRGGGDRERGKSPRTESEADRANR